MRTDHIVTATAAHAAAVAARVRAEDAQEAFALSGLSPIEAVEQSLARSMHGWAWVEDGEALAIFGVGTTSVIGGVGRPWLITSQGVARHRTRFARLSLHALARMRSAYPRLENWVDARYGVCVRYLSWLGFTVHGARPVGMLGLPFHRFEIGVP